MLLVGPEVLLGESDALILDQWCANVYFFPRSMVLRHPLCSSARECHAQWVYCDELERFKAAYGSS